MPASELHAEAINEETAPSESRDETTDEPGYDASFDILGNDGEILIRNNRLTVDDATTQTLTMEEIEELKKVGTGSGREIIAKIMQSHAALDKKTAFSLEKYTLRKRKKYMRRFTVLPLDVSTLAEWMLTEKEAAKIMDIREETIGLATAWLNVHHGSILPSAKSGQNASQESRGRWLVVDDTSGLLVAAMAEKMGVLYPANAEDNADEEVDEAHISEPAVPAPAVADDAIMKDKPLAAPVLPNGATMDSHPPANGATNNHRPTHRRHRRHPPDAMSAEHNTITLVHPASQPNISTLSYFGFDPTDTLQTGSSDSSSHPLHTRFKSLSWLQLLEPNLDTTYEEPEVVSDEVLESWKAGKRGTYYRKRRRWERTKRVVDETREGGFDGLLVSSATSSDSILRHLVPLLRGGAQVVVYSPNVEPLAELSDAYSSARRVAYLQALEESEKNEDADSPAMPGDDFPLDPRLLLSTNLQTVRAREWQVLPGRTHPLMTSRGGAEGYVFTGTRVLPVEGRVSARGTFAKKRKLDTGVV